MQFSSDDDLVDAIKEGRSEAFRHLKDVFVPKILALLRRSLPLTEAEREDIAVETIEDVFLQKIASFKSSKGRFLPWLSRIALNKAINHLRRTKSADIVPLTYEMADSRRSSRSSLPYTKAIPFYSAVESLPLERDRKFVELWCKNVPEKEIAKAFGLSASSYRKYKSRVFDRLKKHLGLFPEFQYLFTKDPDEFPG